MFLIGVGSQAQHGKDTLSNYLAQALNQRMGKEFWKRAAFANNVKRIYCETFNKDMDFVEKWKVIHEAPPGMQMSVRKSLQFIGDGFRQIQGDIWIDLMFRDDTPKVISDVRYINELAAVKNRDGLNILVARADKLNDDPNGSEAQIRPLVMYALGLSAERPAAMDYIDFVVINNGSVDELYHNAYKLVPQILHYYQLD